MKKILPLFIVPAALVQLAPLHAQLSGTSLDVGSGNSLDINGYSGAIGSSNSTYVTYGNYGASLQIGNSNALWDAWGVLSVGDSNSASGSSQSAMIGLSNYSGSSYTSAVVGSYNTVYTTDSLIVGSYNAANGGTMIVAGQNNDITAISGGAFAFGTGLAASYYSNPDITFFGHYNDTNINYYDPLFVIGNGSDSSNRRNAFEVYQNGDINIPGGKLSVFATPSSTSGIVLDPAAGQITINGQPVLTSNASGFVGIGTGAATPFTNLQVQGATAGKPQVLVNSTSSSVSPAIELKDNAATPNRWQLASGASNATDGKFVIQDARQGQSRLVIDAAGNVGIGTTSPQVKLDIKGAVSIYDTIPNRSAGVPNGNIILPYGGSVRFTNDVNNDTVGVLSLGNYGGTGNSLVIGNTATSAWPASIQFRTSTWPTPPTERMRIDTNGNVGIGTTSPTATLDIHPSSSIAANNGSALRVVYPAFPTTPANSTQYALGQIQMAPLYGQTTVLSLGRVASSSGGSVNTDGTVLGTMLFNGTGTDGGTFRKGAEISAVARTTNWGNSTWPTDISFLVNSGTQTTALQERMRITSDGLVNLYGNASATTPTIVLDPNTPQITVGGQTFTNGNLGLGVANPSAKLDILSTADQVKVGYDVSNYFKTTVSNNGSVTMDAVGTAPSFIFNDKVASTGGLVIADKNGVMSPMTGYTERFSIGIPAPGNTDTASGGGYANTNAYRVFDWGLRSTVASGNIAAITFKQFPNGSGADTTVDINTRHEGVSYGGLHIDRDGNLGLGTLAPSATLHVISTGEPFRIGYDVSNYVSQVVGSAGGYTLAPTVTNGINLYAGTGTVAKGWAIGGTDIRALLTLQKNDTSLYSADTDMGDTGREFMMENLSNSNVANQFANISLQVNPFAGFSGGRVLGDIRLVRETANQSNSFFLFSAFRQGGAYKDFAKVGYDSSYFVGNLGVGTTTPQAKLDVNGSARISGQLSFYGTANPNTPAIVIDPNATTVTVNGQSLVTATSTSAQNFTAPSYSFNSAGTSRLSIDASGNVGIGTSSPGERLSVRSGDDSSATNILSINAANGTQGIGFSYTGIRKLTTLGANDFSIDAASTGNILLNANGGSGNVGIGTNSPTAALSVAAKSNVRATAAFGKTLIDWEYEQGWDGGAGTVWYTKIADVAYNNGSVLIEGILSGHEPNQGKAAVKLLVSQRRDGGNVTTATPATHVGSVIGNIGASADLLVFENADASASIYLKTKAWAEVNLKVTGISASVTLSANPATTTTPPTGTPVYTLSANAQQTIKNDGTILMAKRQGDILMGEFGNGND